MIDTEEEEKREEVCTKRRLWLVADDCVRDEKEKMKEFFFNVRLKTHRQASLFVS